MADEPRSNVKPRDLERAVAAGMATPTNPEYFEKPAQWGAPGTQLPKAHNLDTPRDLDELNRATVASTRVEGDHVEVIEPTNPALVPIEKEIDAITAFLNKELDGLDAATKAMRDLVNSSAANLKSYMRNYGTLGEKVLSHKQEINTSLDAIKARMTGNTNGR